MNPFYFGSSAKPLYGVFHPARAGSPGPAVLLCYPMGSEYMRAHRAFRQASSLLTKAGAQVLRFDYFGTGDSAGEGEEASIGQWLDDTESAIDELRDMTGAKQVSLMGLRMGATIAARVAARRTDVDRVVLWDPVVSGIEYFRELLQVGRFDPLIGKPAGPGEIVGTLAVTGFPISETLRREILKLDLTDPALAGKMRHYLVVSQEKQEYVELQRSWSAANTPVQYQHIASEGNWAEDDRFGSALIPQEIIQGVISCLVEGRTK
jgi:pimeloyl-ACP methyl ester carboxylesterase